VGDLDGDGKMELVGMLIRTQAQGKLPADKAAVYMMTYEGKRPAADNWTTHVIKWGDGDGAKGLNTSKTGEKWDHCRFADVDGDGDLDIIGNCEEYYSEKFETIIGVAWLENPGKDMGHRTAKLPPLKVGSDGRLLE